MATPQGAEPKRKVLVAPTLNGNNKRSLVLAGIAAIVSIGAHAVLMFLVLNMDLNAAKASGEDQKEKKPLVDDENKAKKAEEKKADRGKEDIIIDTSRIDIGIDPSNPNLPSLAELGEPMLNSMASPTVPLGLETTLLPRPPGASGWDSESNGSLPNIPGLPANLGGPNGNQIPSALSCRTPGANRQRLLDDGGSKESEAMVGRGLQFLVNHQDRDGHWSMHEFNRHARKLEKKDGKETYVYAPDKSDPQTSRQDDVAGTAFGLLPFLAGGHTSNPIPGSQFDYSKSVKAGLLWLVKHQDRDGNFGGTMYSHAIATIAMCEAYGLTADPLWRTSARKAIYYIEASQDPAGGGWRYGPKQPGDTSVTGWFLMALKSGQMSGLTVKPETLRKVDKYLDTCESTNKGGYSYTPGGGETSQMTAVGLLCRQYLGVTPLNPGLLAGVDRLEKHPPHADHSIYYLYYATQVMHHMGGDNWKKWNEGVDGKPGIRDTLISLMDKGTTNPDLQGSWLLDGGDGRLMSTSLALLTLEVYYRHLPLYRRDIGAVKGGK